MLTDIDTGDCIELTGYQLMTSGITIHIDSLQDAKNHRIRAKSVSGCKSKNARLKRERRAVRIFRTALSENRNISYFVALLYSYI